MNEVTDVVHKTAEGRTRPEEGKDIPWFLASD